jgi:ubiquitin-protein ligase
MRRLRNDLAALERLRSESSVFRFTSQGDPPQHYRIQFVGRGLWRDHGKVRVLERHHVEIKLGSSYPRTIPEIRWLTPVYHPNISEIGMVCLGGYGTHWVPSVQLDELCAMLWDMVRYHNYDIRSPYNRDAALWVAQQQSFRFPTDERPLRDLRAALGRIPAAGAAGSADPSGRDGSDRRDPEAPARRRLSRVRDLAQRYRRVLGAAAEEPVSRRPEPAEPARTLPVNSELHDLVAAQAAATGPQAASSGDEAVIILEPESSDGARPTAAGTPAAAEGSASQPLFARPSRDATAPPREDTVNVAAEVRRLLAGREPAGSPSDEIVFIE